MNKYCAVTLMCIISILIHGLFVTNISHAQQSSGDIIVATVNGRSILKSQLDQAVAQELRKLDLNKSVVTRSKPSKTQIRAEKLNELILHELLKEEAIKKEIYVSYNEIEHHIRIEKSHFYNEETFFQYMNHVYDDYATYRTMLENRLLRKKVIQELAGTANKITENMMRDYYAKNLDHFQVPETRTIEYITLFYNDGFTTGDKRAARKIMKKILHEIQDGKNMLELKKQYQSETFLITTSIINGVQKNKLWPELDSQVFTLEEGETSSVIENETGLYILKCLKIVSSHTRSYESSTDEIRERLHYILYSEQEKLVMQQLRNSARIQIF